MFMTLIKSCLMKNVIMTSYPHKGVLYFTNLKLPELWRGRTLRPLAFESPEKAQHH